MFEDYSASGVKARAGRAKKNTEMLDAYLQSEATIVEKLGLVESKLTKEQAKKNAIRNSKVYLEEWNSTWKKAST